MLCETIEIQRSPAQPRAGVSHISKLDLFAAEIDELGKSIKRETGLRDYKQLKKMETWGRVATVLGYATAWIIPNPISMYLIGQGNYTRWSLVLHPISHGAMDGIEGVPESYTSRKFAKGLRRYFDWFDWIAPQSWDDEHNKLHHYHLGTVKDPDVVWRNAAIIRDMRVPLFVRYAISILIACIWKPFYYAPNTLAESQFLRGKWPTNHIGWANWNPTTSIGRKLWFGSLLPYSLFRFALLPMLFFPFGAVFALNVFINSVFGELVANLQSFITIAPNHTGDDIHTYSDPARGRGNYYVRQILGTINFPAGNDFVDFLYGGMNYQIEHHLWPEASLRQCQRIRPKLKALCKKYGINYKEEPVGPRVVKTIQMMAGACGKLETVPQQKLV